MQSALHWLVERRVCEESHNLDSQHNGRCDFVKGLTGRFGEHLGNDDPMSVVAHQLAPSALVAGGVNDYLERTLPTRDCKATEVAQMGMP